MRGVFDIGYARQIDQRDLAVVAERVNRFTRASVQGEQAAPAV